MAPEIQGLFDRLLHTPFPALGKRVGDFPLYDGLLAGCAERASRGESVSSFEIPILGEETSQCVSELRHKSDLTQEELTFLKYFDLLEQIRKALIDRTDGEKPDQPASQ